jgi:hypothetical protein
MDETGIPHEGGTDSASASDGAGRGALVHFEGRERPFLVVWTCCGNPDCDCEEVTLEFAEVRDSEGPEAPVSFWMRLGLTTWAENDPHDRPPLTAGLAGEFLRDLTDDMKLELRRFYDERKRFARRLATFEIPVADVKAGTLVSYADIVSETGSVSSGGRSIGWRFEHRGRDYLVEDMYCPNPDCRCNEVVLRFIERTEEPERTLLIDPVVIRLGFGGHVDLDVGHGYTEAQATGVFEEWRRHNPDVIETLKARYRDVKDIGSRILSGGKKRGAPAVPSAAEPSGKPGRNAPCPCGSGKKYKRCCGR